MKQQLHVEVEPLTTQRWAKIERSLSSRLELEARGIERADARQPLRNRSVSRWLAVALAASLATVLVLAFNGSKVPQHSEHPSRITTGPTPSHLVFPGLTLDVEAQSAVVVGAETSQGLLVVLDRGSISCQVAPRADNAPMVVQAGAVRVRVVGTRFRVVREGEAAAVDVAEGIVEVTLAGQSWRVLAGQRWPAVAAESREPAAIAPKDPGSQVAFDSPANPPGAAAPGVPKPTSGKPSPRSRPGSESPNALDIAKSPTPTPAGSESPASGASVSHTPPGPQSVFEQATALERSDPGRAAQLYRSLEAGNDTWAQNALYAHGRLAAAHGNTKEARRLLERYLKRFPEGSNAHDARAVLQRLR
jgi:hypothetical protein